MSEETYSKLQHAIQEHFNDSAGGIFVTGWVLFASGTNGSTTGYYKCCQAGQPFHATVGLYDIAGKVVSTEMSDLIDGDD